MSDSVTRATTSSGADNAMIDLEVADIVAEEVVGVTIAPDSAYF